MLLPGHPEDGCRHRAFRDGPIGPDPTCPVIFLPAVLRAKPLPTPATRPRLEGAAAPQAGPSIRHARTRQPCGRYLELAQLGRAGFLLNMAKSLSACALSASAR